MRHRTPKMLTFPDLNPQAEVAKRGCSKPTWRLQMSFGTTHSIRNRKGGQHISSRFTYLYSLPKCRSGFLLSATPRLLIFEVSAAGRATGTGQSGFEENSDFVA